jgi:tRNA threonylcarbamoyladenosine biosynthesis protein TsaE
MRIVVRCRTKSAEQTREIAARIAAGLKPCRIVGLIGTLGSGKTEFVKGVCAALGFTGRVTSPTFTLLHQYPTQPPVFHFDCYRIRNPREMAETGFDEIIREESGVVLVEWADIIGEYFDQWDLVIRFEPVQEEDTWRDLTISSDIPVFENLLSALGSTYGIPSAAGAL